MPSGSIDVTGSFGYFVDDLDPELRSDIGRIMVGGRPSVVESYPIAVTLCIATMRCWGSWANTGRLMIKRREFMVSAGAVTGLVSTRGVLASVADGKPFAEESASPPGARGPSSEWREGESLAQVAFPMGGIGAGMICLEGTGALSKFSLHHRPDLDQERQVFAAVAIKGLRTLARVLEGPVPAWKLRPQWPGQDRNGCWGLPRFREVKFEAQFPFATVRLKDSAVPLEVTLTGWSPFSPGDADNASLPVAGLDYTFTNRRTASVDAVFSFNAENLMAEPPNAGPLPIPESERLIKPGSTDLTLSFRTHNNAPDLGGRDRIHFLMRCLQSPSTES
jgi:hypothetical protein